MSLGARIVIAAFAALFGALMAAVAPPTDKAPLSYAFAAFCLAIAVACIAPGRVAQFFGSVVATAILLLSILYFVSMLGGGPFFTGRRSDQSLVNSLLFLGVFGLPSAAYLWRAKFGLGRREPPTPSTGGGGSEA